MPKATTSISFEGDKDDVRVIRHMAELRGMNIARFVRSVIEETHGDEFAETRERLFFAQHSSSKNQSELLTKSPASK